MVQLLHHGTHLVAIVVYRHDAFDVIEIERLVALVVENIAGSAALLQFVRAFAVSKSLEHDEKCPAALVSVYGGIEVEVHARLSLANGCAEAIPFLHQFFPNDEKTSYIKALFVFTAHIHAFVLLSL